MKRVIFTLLLLLCFFLFLITPYDDLHIRITIIIPEKFVPYYDWLLDFPGWQITPGEPLPTDIRIEHG